MKCSGIDGIRVLSAFALALLMTMSGVNFLEVGEKNEKVSAQELIDAPTKTTQDIKPKGGQLKVALQDDLKTLNPLVANDVWTWKYLTWIYDGLVSRDKDTDELIPWMLEWWYYDENVPNHAVMKLREDIFWHDHVPGSQPGDLGYHQVTASDVVFTYNLLRDTPRYMTDIEPIVNGDYVGAWNVDNETYSTYGSEPIETKQSVFSDSTNQDDFIIQLEMINPDFMGKCYARFVEDIIDLWPVLPKHIWESHVDDKESWDMDFDFYTHEAPGLIGCGPFKYGKWDPLQTARLDTNENYFQGRANIDSILFRIYGTTEAAVLALENGDVDHVAWTIYPGFVPQLEENPDVKIADITNLDFYYMTFNFRNPAFGYDEWNSSARIDAGRPLREAIAYCVDKETIVARILQNYGTIGSSVVSPTNKLWHNDSVAEYEFDPEKAKQILDQYGYIDVNGDGYRDGPGSTPENVIPIDGPEGDGEIEILTPPADYDPIITSPQLIIADQLQTIGINARSAPTAFGQIVERMNALDFEMYSLGWSIGSRDGNYMWDLFHSSQADPGEYNAPGYNNESYDEIVDAMRRECSLEKRIELNKWAQGTIAQDVVYDVLYYKNDIEAYSTNRFKGWVEEDITGVFNYHTLMGIYQGPIEGLEVSITGLVSDIASEGQDDFTVTVKKDGLLIEGADIFLSVEGTASDEENEYGTLSRYEGTTDSNGQIKDIVYTAPVLDEGSSPKPIHIYVEAKVEGEILGTQAVITVHPPGTVGFISVSIESISGEIIDSGDSIQLVATVLNQDGMPVEHAIIRMNASHSGASFDKMEATTNEEGKALFELTVVLPKEDKNKVGVIITASAQAKDYFNSPENTLSITILPKKTLASSLCPKCNLMLMIIASMVICVVITVVSIFLIKWRKKH